MVTSLYLVRHAHSTYTPEELQRPLSEKGLSDVEKINKLLLQENIDCVISSPYLRAVQTVEGIAKGIEKEIIIMDAFKERQLSLKPVNDFPFAVKKVWNDSAFCFEGGESNDAAQKRGMDSTLIVLERYEGKKIVIGTHGNLMVLIMNYFDHHYGYDFWKQLTMPDIYKLTFEKTKLIDVRRIWKEDEM